MNAFEPGFSQVPREAEAPEDVSAEERPKKFKAGIVDIEALAEENARDAAERALTDSKKEVGSWWKPKAFWKRIWNHTVAREHYRQQYILKARSEIKKSGNLYANEAGDTEEANEKTRVALVKRFTSEYEELVHDQRREAIKGGPIRARLTSLIKKYAEGAIDDANFEEEKKRVVSGVQYIQGSDAKAMYADNLLETARQVKEAAEHGYGLDNLDRDLEMNIGVARGSIKSEAHYNFVDRAIEKIKKSKLGVVLNESTIATGVAVASGVAAALAKGLIRNRALAWGTIGASYAFSAVVTGVAENKRTKEDRRQHAREMAQGRAYGADSPRREAMDKYIHEMVATSGLTANIRNSIYETTDGGFEPKALTKNEVETALLSIAEAEARINLMSREKIDLLVYSSPTKIEEERLDLDMARAKAKRDLKKMVAKLLPEEQKFGGDGKTWDAFLQDIINARMGEIEKGVRERNTAFKGMQLRRVAGAIAKSAVYGITGGMIGGALLQEGVAHLPGHIMAGVGSAEAQKIHPHTTAIEAARRYIGGLFHHGSGIVHENILAGKKIELPEGMTAKADGHGGFMLMRGHAVVAENLRFAANGTISKDSLAVLSEHGVFGHSDSVHMEHQVTDHVSASHYLAQHNLGTHVSRDGWFDNDTPKPVFDKNELKLWWGGAGNTGVDEHGNIVFTMDHMMPGGSYHQGLSVDAQKLAKAGMLRVLLSLSEGTQTHPVELMINPDGTVRIDPHSAIGKLFFSMKGGHPNFLGRFAEVAQLTNIQDGLHHVKILATYEGQGTDHLMDVVRTVQDMPKNILTEPNDFTWEWPLPVPLYERRPLEPTRAKGGADDSDSPLALGGGRFMAPMLRDDRFMPPMLRDDRFRPPMLYAGSGFLPPMVRPEDAEKARRGISSRLESNPGADLDSGSEGEIYFAKQTPEHMAKVEALAAQAGEMAPECRISVMIPVAGHKGGKSIEQTLSSYLTQDADPKTFELVVFVNHPATTADGKPVASDGTLRKVQAFREAHPELPIRIMQSAIPPEEVTQGNIRKLMADATLQRSLARENAPDLIMVNNNADVKGVASTYVENYVQRFDAEKTTDLLLGELDGDPEAYVRQPIMHVGMRLMQYMSLQRYGRPIDFGMNAAFRGSIYAAVGGYDASQNYTAEPSFRVKIAAARQGAPERKTTAFAGSGASRLYTSSERVEKDIEAGLTPLEAWDRGLIDEVKKAEWEDVGETPNFDDPETRQKFITNVETMVNQTFLASSRLWSEQPIATYQRRALQWLGVDYEPTGANTIKITNADGLIDGLKEYAREGVDIMRRRGAKTREESQSNPVASGSSTAETAAEKPKARKKSGKKGSKREKKQAARNRREAKKVSGKMKNKSRRRGKK